MISTVNIPNGFIYHYINDDFNGDYLVLIEETGASLLELTEFNTNTLYIRQISVEINSRLKGKANILLEMATYIAKNSNKKVLMLDTKENSWMIEWYRRHGFEIDGTMYKGYTNLIKHL